jgi:hypothetical protein
MLLYRQATTTEAPDRPTAGQPAKTLRPAENRLILPRSLPPNGRRELKQDSRYARMGCQMSSSSTGGLSVRERACTVGTP